MAIFVLLLLLGADAKQVSGHLSTYEEWIYVDKFCFAALGNNSGFVDLIFHGHDTASNFTVLLYDDQRVEWSKVFRSSEPCAERLTHAHTVLPATSSDIHRKVTISEFSRPRWWYVVVATCGSRSLLDVKYQMQFTNSGGLLEGEFSWNEQGLLQSYLVLSVLLTAWTITYGYNRAEALQSARRLHTAPSVVFGMLCVLSGSLWLSALHYTVYALDGFGLPWARFSAWLGRMTFQLGGIIFGVAMAKGWTISNEGLKTDPRFSMLVGMVVCLHLLAFFWHYYVQDPADVENIFNTPPGLFLVALRAAALFWFWWELRQNIKYYSKGSQGRTFYLLFGAVFSVWMLSFPAYVIGAYFMPPWMMQRMMSTLVTCTDAVASVLLGWCAWPLWIAHNMDASGHVREENEVGLALATSYALETSHLMGGE